MDTFKLAWRSTGKIGSDDPIGLAIKSTCDQIGDQVDLAIKLIRTPK